MSNLTRNIFIGSTILLIVALGGAVGYNLWHAKFADALILTLPLGVNVFNLLNFIYDYNVIVYYKRQKLAKIKYAFESNPNVLATFTEMWYLTERTITGKKDIDRFNLLIAKINTEMVKLLPAHLTDGGYSGDNWTFLEFSESYFILRRGSITRKIEIVVVDKKVNYI